VELLLTPGVFLRLDENSAVKMISPSLLNTQVELDRGRANIEVDEIHPANSLQIDHAGFTTRLLKNGLYAFDADKNTVRVFKGEAELMDRSTSIQRPLKLKAGREVNMDSGESLKTVSFDRDQAQDALYRWSSLRSEYLAEANLNLASSYAGYGGFTPGWYWDPGFWGYTWLPANWYFGSPFGWGFYSPRFISYYGGPGFYGGRGFAQVRGYGRAFAGGGVHAMGGGGFHGR
jgi:hypothetical protein